MTVEQLAADAARDFARFPEFGPGDATSFLGGYFRVAEDRHPELSNQLNAFMREGGRAIREQISRRTPR